MENHDVAQTTCMTKVTISPNVVSLFSCQTGAVSIGFCAIIVFAGDSLLQHEGWAIITISVLSLFMVLLLLIIWRQPQNQQDLIFKVNVYLTTF